MIPLVSPDQGDVAALADLLPVGVVVLDGDGVALWANATWNRLIGEEASSGSLRWLGPMSDADRATAEAAFAVARQRGVELHHRYRLTRADGSRVWFEVRTSPFIPGSGPDVRLTAVLTDVTGAVELETELARASEAATATAQQLAAFIAGVSHEIRTPLNGVIGLADHLLTTQMDADQHADLYTLKTTGDQLVAMLDDIIDYSRIGHGRLELDSTEFELLPVVHGVASLFASRAFDRGVRLRVSIDPLTPTWVIGDPTRLRQILSNLVSNAVKFTERGSVVINVDARGDDVTFSVTDTGIGIAAGALDRIFEPFRQADSKTSGQFGGSGLGLAICRQLVELMSGRITVTSEDGSGSTFTVVIPLPATTPPRPDLVSRPAAPPRDARILLVEDNAVNRRVAVAMLGRLGFVAQLASDGAAAIDRWRADSYDLILMDCQMPLLDGYEATERIRLAEPAGVRVPIIALTAGTMVGDRERCLAAGMDDYLSKPLDVTVLGAMLDQWLPA
jgi:PAS domain S-box-containing protein